MTYLTEPELLRLGVQYAAYDAKPERVYLTFSQFLEARVGDAALPPPDCAAMARKASLKLGARPSVKVLGIVYPPLILCQSVEPRWFKALLALRRAISRHANPALARPLAEGSLR